MAEETEDGGQGGPSDLQEPPAPADPPEALKIVQGGAVTDESQRTEVVSWEDFLSQLPTGGLTYNQRYAISDDATNLIGVCDYSIERKRSGAE
eukprot:1098270-Amphidinium_carterae.1